MGEQRYELCFVCNAHTDRAGRADDSIYLGGIGPWCETCYAEARDAVLDNARIDGELVEASALASARAEVERLRERERVLTEALTPSGATKAAYIGEHKCDHVRDGDEPHLISWSVVKDIMAMIRARAALSPESKT